MHAFLDGISFSADLADLADLIETQDLSDNTSEDAIGVKFLSHLVKSSKMLVIISFDFLTPQKGED